MSNSGDWVFQNVLNLFWETIFNKLEKDTAFVLLYLQPTQKLKSCNQIKCSIFSEILQSSSILTFSILKCGGGDIFISNRYGITMLFVEKNNLRISSFLLYQNTIFQRRLCYYVQKQAVDKEQAI